MCNIVFYQTINSMTQINFENRLPAGVVTAKEIESANGVPESSNAFG
jgi:hypothetical protein